MPFVIFLAVAVLVIMMIENNWAQIWPWLQLGFWVILIGFTVSYLSRFIKKWQQRILDVVEKNKAEKERLIAVSRQQKELAERRKLELEGRILQLRSANILRIGQIPQLVGSANEQLHEAKLLFNERMFYPFWDKLEESTRTLASVQGEMQNVERDSKEYLGLSKSFGGSVPAFPASSSLGVQFSKCRNLSMRVRETVKSAHKDFEFASIYGTRMTNNLLKSGFSNLIQSLDEITTGIHAVGDRLTDGFDHMAKSNLALSAQISESASEFSKAITEDSINSRVLSTEVLNEMRFQGQSISEMNAESSRRQGNAIEMLDRIERKEAPPPKWLSN